MRDFMQIINENAGRVYYHVTERDYAQDIIQNGFLGGWGDVGFGVYLYGNMGETKSYAEVGGWDNGLEDPVILAVSDASIVPVTDLDPSWDAAKYADMHWRPMDEDDEDQRWKPQHVSLVS